jgi:D-beta-D-heptose 7-phosphate kinase/D-beta-D-heptose 1-phosphate adenosyltransferase
VRIRDSERRLGGAANVAHQLKVLGATVHLAGTVGDDPAGRDVLRLCEDAGIETRAILVTPERPTTRKVRVLGQGQQLVRLDWEQIGSCRECVTNALIAALDDCEAPDFIVISDYAKGVVTQRAIDAAVRMGRGRGIPILVDPKCSDFARYHGATVVTPNLRELEMASGRQFEPDDTGAITEEARRMLVTAGSEAFIVTLGDRGMLVIGAESEVSIPALRRSVYDVTGAGDTAIAVLAMSLGAGAPLLDAARIANAAAGIAVEQIGTAAVVLENIRDALMDLPATKIFGVDELEEKAQSWRMSGKRIVFTNGCFDLLHAGHLMLLNEAAKLGDILLLAINSDASVRRLKGGSRPVVPQADRAALLSALSCVDAVTIFDDDTPLEILKRIRPHILVKGGDYSLENVVGRDLLEEGGGRVVLIPSMPDRSTSDLVERIKSGS